MELLENGLQLVGRNADAGIPDLQAQLAAARVATNQDAAALGIFDRVREQVADHLLEQVAIAAHPHVARNHAPAEPFPPV